MQAALGARGHPRILREAGLRQRRRAGRPVLYYRTEVGIGLVSRKHSDSTPAASRYQ
jgi:hypothetical protein